MIDIDQIDPKRPVLIAGATASGKSALAMAIARAQGGVIVNADALQVYEGWHILTARPDSADCAEIPHALYGHVPFEATYSAGAWLRDVMPYLSGPRRPIIVGGTGLYFRALTEGLAEIPPISPELRARADAMASEALLADLDSIDPVLAARIDRANRARVQRGWEVFFQTGKPLSQWQAMTAPPALPLARAQAFLIDAPAHWINPRIARRFDQMLGMGVLDEVAGLRVRFALAGGARAAIGAQELIDYLDGQTTLPEARERAIIATRQYAKKQRSWFRSRMQDWTSLQIKI